MASDRSHPEMPARQGLPSAAWLFDWRQPGGSIVRNGLLVLAVAAGFAFLLGFVHVRVVPPTPWAAHKGAVIQIRDDAPGRALKLRAREGGPFPSRFEPSLWQGAARLEQAALDAIRWQAPRYVPELRNLPEEVPPSVTLAARGEPTLPKLHVRHPARPPAAAGGMRLAPVLSPISGITAAEMPAVLPRFGPVVDQTLSAEPWRFLVKLNRAGAVEDCVSLAGGEEAGPRPLEEWLRRVAFGTDPGKASRWIAVAVSFTNQPANGPDVH